MDQAGTSKECKARYGEPSGDDNKSEEQSGENDDAHSTLSFDLHDSLFEDLAENIAAIKEGIEDAYLLSNGSRKSSQTFDEARCSETMPSTDSNKENFDSNNYTHGNPSGLVVSGEQMFGEYDNPDQIPLPELLKIHVTQLVSGFEFGEATKRRAQENMKTARDKNKSETRKSGDLEIIDLEKESDDVPELVNIIKNFDLENGDMKNFQTQQPCCSKTLSEAEHKTPHSRKRQRSTDSAVPSNADKDFSKITPRVPHCLLPYSDCKDTFIFMINKEEASLKLRNPRLFDDFKSVTPRMRAILLDWLMEVASVYHLRRVTYYLSVDYFDRFLSIRPDIPKSLLQLVGITCLYIAAKVEEIYPPNLSEFSYVCDGACNAEDMVSCELLILNSLGWEVILTTPTDWLNLYMQLHTKTSDVISSGLSLDFNKDFLFSQYSAYQFTLASQLIDLLSLDAGFLKFGYSVIAAAAMYYLYGKKVALSVSGLTCEELGPCVEYMKPFFEVINQSPDPRLHSGQAGPSDEGNQNNSGPTQKNKTNQRDENHSFQNHIANMEYFEEAVIMRIRRYGSVNKDQMQDGENWQYRQEEQRWGYRQYWRNVYAENNREHGREDAAYHPFGGRDMRNGPLYSIDLTGSDDEDQAQPISEATDNEEDLAQPISEATDNDEDLAQPISEATDNVNDVEGLLAQPISEATDNVNDVDEVMTDSTGADDLQSQDSKNGIAATSANENILNEIPILIEDDSSDSDGGVIYVDHVEMLANSSENTADMQ